MNIVFLLKCYILCTLCMKIKKTNKKKWIHHIFFHSTKHFLKKLKIEDMPSRILMQMKLAFLVNHPTIPRPMEKKDALYISKMTGIKHDTFNRNCNVNVTIVYIEICEHVYIVIYVCSIAHQYWPYHRLAVCLSRWSDDAIIHHIFKEFAFTAGGLEMTKILLICYFWNRYLIS